MARNTYIFLAFVTDFTLLLSAATVPLKCQRENLGISSQNSLISCSVKPETSDVNIEVVLWKKDGITVFLYYNNEIKTESQRFSFAESNWDAQNMNVSLMVKDTKLADEGQYKCEVMTDIGEAENYTSLKVKARYSKPVMSSIPEKDIREDMRVQITCRTSGGYPAGEIHWYDLFGTNWTRSAKTDVVQTKDKFFNLTSNLTVLRASSIYTGYKCVVLDSNREWKEEAQYNLTFALEEDPENTRQEGERRTKTLTAVFVVAGSLACGLLILMLLRRRRSRRYYQQNPELPLEIYKAVDQKGPHQCHDVPYNGLLEIKHKDIES